MKLYIKDIIAKKRDGHALSDAEICYFVNGYTNGSIADYQAAALCMAIYLRGMNQAETVALTQAIAQSGQQIDLSEFGTLTADKHSTGGVGDKTTLIASPIAAACGVYVAKLAGRGLGHTGGTIDKLSAIPGYRSELTAEEFRELVRNNGIAVVSQSGDIAPADKKLYALRDVTGTVESMPLIISSVMSKKIAAGAACIVLDVKYGSGAFIKSRDEAQQMADSMVEIGRACGRRISAVVNCMDAPLGCAVGNAIEVGEAVDVLSNRDNAPDLREQSIVLAAHMISMSLDVPLEDAMTMATNALESGDALAKFRLWISSQGGDTSFIENNDLPLSPHTYCVVAPKDGNIAVLEAQKVGEAACHLGAGRKVMTDTIDPGAGIYLHHKSGKIKAGEKIATLYSSCSEKLTQAIEIFNSSITYGE